MCGWVEEAKDSSVFWLHWGVDKLNLNLKFYLSFKWIDQVSEVLDYDRAADKPWTRLTQGDKVKHSTKAQSFEPQILRSILICLLFHAGIDKTGAQWIQVSGDGGDKMNYGINWAFQMLFFLLQVHEDSRHRTRFHKPWTFVLIQSAQNPY